MAARTNNFVFAAPEAVVLGASAGGVQALQALLPRLPEGLGAPVVVVIHLSEARPSLLPEVLARGVQLPVKEAEDKERLSAGTVYLAPPGYHLFIEEDRSFALSVDEPVHYSRPSIDVLFESAAYVFGACLLGILLTGASQDGAAGLKAIRKAGGVTIVQTPESAEAPAMPTAAINACPPSFILTLEEIASFLSQLDIDEAPPGGEHLG